MDMSTEEMGLVWMGDMLLNQDPGGLMINSAMDPHRTFFPDAQQSLDEIRQPPPPQMYLQDMNGFVLLDDMEENYYDDDGTRGTGDSNDASSPASSLMMNQDQSAVAGQVAVGGHHLAGHLSGSTTGSATGSTPTDKSAVSKTEERGRKIKPVKHPGLKLQTPIAYQRDTDISVIPIMKDGMAVCEKCGAIGVKHAFYTRERRFCSLACARGSTEGPPQPSSADLEQDENPRLTQQCDSEKMEVDAAVKVRIHANIPMGGGGGAGVTQQVLGGGSHHQQLSSPARQQQVQPLQQTPPPQSVTTPTPNATAPAASSPSPGPPPMEDEPQFPPDKRTLHHLLHTYEWNEALMDPNFVATTVSSFPHAPMSLEWDNITVGMKVEVENTDCDCYTDGIPDSFWVATVLKVAGYKAMLRYEGFGTNESKDFWVNLCSSSVHPVGWCANRGKPLIPPKTIEDKYKDWKQFLVKRLTGARTLPSNFYSKVHENMKSRFRCDLNLEVVDKNRISQVKVATIKNIIGKRLHVQYYDSDPNMCNGFWAHEDSPLIHPVGWAKRVGQTLAAPETYVDRCQKGLRDKDDATEDLFPIANALPYHSGFEVGMKLEAVDPLNLSSICVATVMKVLNEGYLMIRIDSYDEDAKSPGQDWFCYHSSSACLLPPGFCSLNDIVLTPPKGYDVASFTWEQYLKDSCALEAPSEIFDLEAPEHSFEAGQRLEAADLMDPRLVCVATIARIVGRLVRVHFDGWEDEYDQWLDCQSPDMFPVGWCELVSHKLEAPHGYVGSKQTTPPKVKGEGKKRRRGRRLMGKGKGGKSDGSDHSPHKTGGSKRPTTVDVPPIGGGSLATAATTPSQVNSQPSKLTGYYSDSESACLPEEKSGHLPDGDSGGATSDSSDSPASKKVKVVPKVEASAPSRPPPPQPLQSAPTKPDPFSWTVDDVSSFLRVNNCSLYCDNFVSASVDGKRLLTLGKDEIVELTGKKVGPSLKIFDLIQQLKSRASPSLDRRFLSKKLL